MGAAVAAATETLRILRWRPVEGVGLEQANFEERKDGVRVRGVIIGSDEARDFGLRYELVLDPDWRTRMLVLERTDGRTEILHTDRDGNWRDTHGDDLPELKGCIDVDLSGTPLTNTLPIRRVAWTLGVPQRFDMTWVPTETLVPRREAQIYTKLADDRWRFQTADGSFEAELTVDADGFVVRYPGLFERLA